MINSTNEEPLSVELRQAPLIFNFRNDKRLARFTLRVSKLIQSELDDPQWKSADFNTVLFNENLDKVQHQPKKLFHSQISLANWLTT
jgi:hypothetical protein